MPDYYTRATGNIVLDFRRDAMNLGHYPHVETLETTWVFRPWRWVRNWWLNDRLLYLSLVVTTDRRPKAGDWITYELNNGEARLGRIYKVRDKSCAETVGAYKVWFTLSFKLNQPKSYCM